MMIGGRATSPRLGARRRGRRSAGTLTRTDGDSVSVDHDLLIRLLGRGARTKCAQLVLDTDWSASPAGAVHAWPATLQSALSTAMTSRFPMLVMVGPELTMAYNDGYAAMLGARHPAAMGRPLAEVWSDVWPTIQPMVEDVWQRQEGNHFSDLELEMTRNGFAEQTYFTFSYSPLLDADGQVHGLLDTALETTASVLVSRRLDLVHRLSALDPAGHPDLRSACGAVLDVLASAPDDITHAGLLLAATSGTGRGTAAQRFGLPGPAADILEAFLADADLDRRQLADLPPLWPDHDPSSAARTLAIPLVPPTDGPPVGALVVQTNPRLPVDDAFRTALRLVAAQVVTTLAAVSARMAEQRHAAADRTMPEALQRSMLTDPVQPDHLQLATRYVPATAEAEVGGDWYDAFLCQDGSTWLVVGDVAGHDQAAAATMGQIRNLLRGIAYTAQSTPAQVLRALDRAMTGLGVQRLTSVLAVRIEQTQEDADHGVRRARWSNAGHPVPLHTLANGTVVPLQTLPEMMLGADHTAPPAPTTRSPCSPETACCSTPTASSNDAATTSKRARPGSSTPSAPSPD